jgi:YggT family protein
MAAEIIIITLIKFLDIYLWVVIITVMLSWLIAFDVINTRNKWMYRLCYFLNEATRPPTLFLRKYVPPLGGIDLTPMIIILAIYVLQALLASLL